jgi:hypothetical protein
VTSGASIEQHFSFDKRRFGKKCDSLGFGKSGWRQRRHESVAKKRRLQNLMPDGLVGLAAQSQNLLAGT